jgi:hypothetical protein
MTTAGLQVTTANEINSMELVTYDSLVQAVGGYLQAVALSEELTLWLHEEGKLEGLPHNEVGQVLWDATYGAGTDYIVGNIAITGGTDEEGETLPLTASAVSKIMQMLN